MENECYETATRERSFPALGIGREFSIPDTGARVSTLLAFAFPHLSTYARR